MLDKRNRRPSFRTGPAFAFLACLLCFAASAAETKSPLGEWSGTLTISGIKLRLLFKIRKTPEGNLTGTLDSLDQGAKDMPIDKATFEDDKLRLEIKLIQGVFEGTVDSTGNKIAGTFSQGSQSLPLNLTRGAGASLDESLSPADRAGSKYAAEKLGGGWNATLKAGADQFRLVLNIKTNRDGTAGGTLDSLDQGLTAIPLNAITFKEGKVHFEARGMGAAYDGVSFNNSSSVTGQWHQAGQTLPLSFSKSGSK